MSKMRSITVFISGPVTGLPRESVIRKFEHGERLLMLNTYNFINPLKHVPEKATQTEAMRILLPKLLKCDAILLLNGYEFSEGSRIEEMLAVYCGLHRYTEDDLI